MAELPPEAKQRKYDKRYFNILLYCMVVFMMTNIFTILFLPLFKSPDSTPWYISDRFATEPAGFGDALMLDAFMRYDKNAYNESSNPEVNTL